MSKFINLVITRFVDPSHVKEMRKEKSSHEGGKGGKGELTCVVKDILSFSEVVVSETIFSASPSLAIIGPLLESSNCKYGLKVSYETKEKSISTKFVEDMVLEFGAKYK